MKVEITVVNRTTSVYAVEVDDTTGLISACKAARAKFLVTNDEIHPPVERTEELERTYVLYLSNGSMTEPINELELA